MIRNALISVLLVSSATSWFNDRPGPLAAHTLQSTAATTCFPVDHLSSDQAAQVDSILASGLDNEALFTFLSDIEGDEKRLPLKPMSSLDAKRLQLGRQDSLSAGEASVVTVDHPDLQLMRDYQKLFDSLECGPIKVVITPFRIVRDGVRNVQVVVVHQGRLDDELNQRAAFWGQWGFVPGADPATLVTVVEFEESGARFRGYGNLFGYPDHAVDFFVSAAEHQERTGDFVERDFLQVPVHSRETGRFVYAVAKGHAPQTSDLAIQEEAARVLARYRSLRPLFTNPDGTLRAADLLRSEYAARYLNSGLVPQ